MSSLLDAVLQRVMEQPDAIALKSPDESFTYEELMTAVEVLAERLRESGLQRLGLCGDNSPGWIIADLACRLAELVCVPVPGFFSEKQVQHLCDSAGLQGLLFGRPADLPAGDIESIPIWGSVCLRTLHTTGVEGHVPAGTAKITFTSGSTGTPRGVCLSGEHQDATVRALAERVGSLGIRRHLCVLPLATLLENVAGVYLPLSLGATVHVWPVSQLGFTGSSQLDVPKLLQALHACQPDSLILVPELATLLVTAAEQGALSGLRFRFLAVGGGKVSTALLDRADAQGLPLYEGYGLSECGSVVALNGPEANRPGCVGKPLSHVEVSMSNLGEILVRGNTHLGYLGDQRRPREPLATGDLGRFDDDGFLVVNGRSKNLLITSYGRNINPEWLESELVQSVGARQALVFGDGEPRPRALLVIADSRDSDAVARAVAELNRTLPDYARLSQLYIRREPLSPHQGHVTANGRLIRPRLMADLGELLAAAEQSDPAAITLSEARCG